MHEIEKLRAEIDLIHVEFAALVRRRLAVTEKIWMIKKAQNLPLVDLKREDLVIHRFDDSISDPQEKTVMQNLMKCILSENKKYLEAKLK